MSECKPECKGYPLSLLGSFVKYMYNDELDVNFGTTISYCAACERLCFVVTFEDWFWNTSTVTRLTLILGQQYSYSVAY